MRRICLAAVLLLLACNALSAQEVRREIGYLTCDLSESPPDKPSTPAAGDTAAPPDQGRDMLCSYRPNGGGPEESYTATVQSIGQGPELSNKRALIWLVKASLTTKIAPGILAQTYAAEKLSPGQISLPLVGDNDRGIVLQSMVEKDPEATEQQAAIPIIAVIALKLRSAPA